MNNRQLAQIKLTNKELYEILCNALNEATWADEIQVIEEDYNHKDEFEHFVSYGLFNIHLANGPIEKGGPEWYAFNKLAIIKGIVNYTSKDPDNAAHMISYNKHQPYVDSHNIDAVDADAILQYALFNEIYF